jgi:hypothetical protein
MHPFFLFCTVLHLFYPLFSFLLFLLYFPLLPLTYKIYCSPNHIGQYSPCPGGGGLFSNLYTPEDFNLFYSTTEFYSVRGNIKLIYVLAAMTRRQALEAADARVHAQNAAMLEQEVRLQEASRLLALVSGRYSAAR